MAKPKTPHQISAERVALIEQWLADDESLNANENAVARAMQEFSITHRSRAERLVSRAAKSFGPLTGGRPQTHARPVFDMRQLVHVSTRDGVEPIATEQGRIVAATKSSIAIQIGYRTIVVSTTPPRVEVDWFNEAP